MARLARIESLAQGMGGDMSKDVSILNVALGLVHEAINACQLGTWLSSVRGSPTKARIMPSACRIRGRFAACEK